eukprot:2141189-Rhodomonas_salina.1
MESFFTVGADEVRAWSVRRGSKAPEAAGAIHSDMQRGFIMAETIVQPPPLPAPTLAVLAAAMLHQLNARGRCRLTRT